MRTAPNGSFLAAAMIAAASAAPASHAQDCLWTSHAGHHSYDMLCNAVYHTGLQRVLYIQSRGSISLTATQIWSWDGNAWSMIDDAGPSPRQAPGVAYDAARDRLVLFGGRLLADTWEWDGTSWTRINVPGPAARSHFGMVYDEARQRTVLFGGYTGVGGAHGDTWEWDGQSWMQVATTGPAPRPVAAMAYDSVRGRTVLYSTWEPWSTLADLWEWDGASWTERPSNSPFARPLWMVFDPDRQRMIIARSGWPREMWELDVSGAAAQWELREPRVRPTGPAAFDTARSRAVVMARFDTSNFTMEYNGAGTAISPYIINQPLGGWPVGYTAVLSVEAGGTGPLSYQWRREGEPLENGGNISGVTTPTLTIDPVFEHDRGMYDVVVSNHCDAITTIAVQVGPTWYAGCYANCDQGYVPPILNVDDFTCFINEFTNGLSLPFPLQLTNYANCDRSTIAPASR